MGNLGLTEARQAAKTGAKCQGLTGCEASLVWFKLASGEQIYTSAERQKAENRACLIHGCRNGGSVLGRKSNLYDMQVNQSMGHKQALPR